MESLLYLGGPIKGGSYEEAVAWRLRVTEALRPNGIICLSPMRWRQHRREEQQMLDGYPDDVMMNQRGVKVRDKFDVKRSSAVLFNLLGARQVSIGTVTEYGWADAFDKPVITVMEDSGNPHDHSFIKEITGYRVRTLEESIDVARRLLAVEPQV